jgi:hypothetical protein
MATFGADDYTVALVGSGRKPIYRTAVQGHFFCCLRERERKRNERK